MTLLDVLLSETIYLAGSSKKPMSELLYISFYIAFITVDVNVVLVVVIVYIFLSIISGGRN